MKLAFLSCKNAKHNCAGSADCMRMFYDRIGEFAPYAADDVIAAVVQCDYCVNHEKSFDRHIESWQNPKNAIHHIHLGACTSICPLGNYEKIKEYFLGKNMTIGEFYEKESK